MKKAVLCLIMLAGITSVAQAQSTRFGVKAGVNLAKVSSDNNEGTKNLVGPGGRPYG